MNRVLQALKQWFGFDRRERRASLILVIITVITFFLRYSVPEKNMTMEYLSSEPEIQKILMAYENEAVTDTKRLFHFDPNTASFDTLKRLGLSELQVRTLVNYRNRGGRFRKPGDISKIYGIDDETTATLVPFISIRGDTLVKMRRNLKSDRSVIELNSADSVALKALPGIGRVLSARIIKYRNLLGGYADVSQLKEVYGMTDEVFKMISGRLRTDTLLVRKIDFRNATFRDLIRLPYLERHDVDGMLKFRDMGLTVKGVNDLIDNKLITEEKAARIRPYIIFER